MTPDKSSLQEDCLSDKISIEVKAEMCLLCPSHVIFLYRSLPQVALNTVGISEMSVFFREQGLRLGCTMGEVGGYQEQWAWIPWRSKQDLLLTSAHLLQPWIVLLQVVSNGRIRQKEIFLLKGKHDIMIFPVWALPPTGHEKLLPRHLFPRALLLHS